MDREVWKNRTFAEHYGRITAMATINAHPGYHIVEDTNFYPGKTTYIPVRLKGGLASDYSDKKGRHLGGCIVTDYPCGIAELFDDENGRVLVFDNHPHTENFLNQWVGDALGYTQAYAAWDKHLAEVQDKEDQEIVKERQDLLALLRAQEAHYKHLGAIYEAAAELIRIHLEGGISREHLGQVARLVLAEPTTSEVARIYQNITETFGLE